MGLPSGMFRILVLAALAVYTSQADDFTVTCVKCRRLGDRDWVIVTVTSVWEQHLAAIRDHISRYHDEAGASLVLRCTAQKATDGADPDKTKTCENKYKDDKLWQTEFRTAADIEAAAKDHKCSYARRRRLIPRLMG